MNKKEIEEKSGKGKFTLFDFKKILDSCSEIPPEELGSYLENSIRNDIKKNEWFKIKTEIIDIVSAASDRYISEEAGKELSELYIRKRASRQLRAKEVKEALNAGFVEKEPAEKALESSVRGYIDMIKGRDGNYYACDALQDIKDGYKYGIFSIEKYRELGDYFSKKSS